MLNGGLMRKTPTAQHLVRAHRRNVSGRCFRCVLFARPARSIVGNAPARLGAQTVAFPSRSGSVIRAWFSPGRRGAGAVLLLHGMGGNRASMLARARFLHQAGFTILAPDFQAHGESPGQHITFGELESLDAEAALAFLRHSAPGERVGIIGISMGGAATLVGAKPLAADALVLESVYPTFKDAVSDRLRTWLGPFGFLGAAAAPTLIQLVAPRIGVDPAHLRPIDAIAGVTRAAAAHRRHRGPVHSTQRVAGALCPRDQSQGVMGGSRGGTRGSPRLYAAGVRAARWRLPDRAPPRAGVRRRGVRRECS